MTMAKQTTGTQGPRGKAKAPGKARNKTRTMGKSPASRKSVTSRRPTSCADGKPGTSLAQEIVIEGAPVGAQTGAQAIAPDHSPRAAPSARPTVPQLAKPASVPATDALREIEQFLYRQSELLDGKLWQHYIDLFADDGVYWMPVMPEQTEWEGSPSIFAEDRYMMEVRMGRVTHPTAWSQAPMWGTSHVIGNVVIESESHDAWVVRSRFHMIELRRDTVRHFGGTYRHTLVRERGQLRIKLQRVDMVNAQAPYDYVLQVWV
jgi:3-phenylpropionate/cinnamic acid dioxygenase small subunit